MGEVQRPASALAPEVIGRYRVLGLLGEGGMGSVYLARAEGLGGFERLVAIKMIHGHLCRESRFIEMFLDEARLAALIHHPNVVSVFEVGQHEGQHFIAMDYCHGETLGLTINHAKRQGLLFPYEIAAETLASASEGLHAAHELVDQNGQPLNVVHRDVSPTNIMLGYDGVVRVMDFGVAKASDRLAHTQTGTTKGKVAYMAPEQIRDGTVDRRADIFALGVVLWETTVGRRLFRASNAFATADLILKGEVARPSEYRPGYPPELEQIVMRALHCDREQRYQSSLELARDLRHYARRQANSMSSFDVQAFMRQAFPDRHLERQEMLRRATAPVPERIGDLPRDEVPEDSNGTGSNDRRPMQRTQTIALRSGMGFSENLQPDATMSREKQSSLWRSQTRGTQYGLVAGIVVLTVSAIVLLADLVRSQSDEPVHEPTPAAIAVTPPSEEKVLELTPPRSAYEAPPALTNTNTHSTLPTAQADSRGREQLREELGERAALFDEEDSELDGEKPKKAKKATVSFVLHPPNAEVKIDGKRSGPRVVLPRSDRILRVDVSAPGYRTKHLSVNAHRSQSIVVRLRRASSPGLYGEEDLF